LQGAFGLFDSVYWAAGAVTGMVDKTPYFTVDVR